MMRVCPISIKEANSLVSSLHRHHKPVLSAKFAIGVRDRLDNLCGAAIVGRPVARMVEHTQVAEVTRLVTDGTTNACSMLYAACARAARAMGYYKIQTYILEEEIGTSLLAAGWEFEAFTAGGDWNHSKANAGTRRTDQPMGRKQRWSKQLNIPTDYYSKA